MVVSCRLALEETRQPHKRKFSQLQSAALARMVADAKGLTAEEWVQIAGLVTALPWADERDAVSVLDAIPTTEPPAKRRRGQQDFTAMHHYMSDMQWQSLQDQQVAEDVKLQSIISHLIRLGLRCPSEPTNKWLCSLWTFLCVPEPGLQRMSAVTKGLRLRTVRTQFQAMVRRADAKPLLWVEKLPRSAVQFMREYRALFDAAFPADMAPITCPVNISTVMGFDLTYRCRGGLSGLRPHTQPQEADEPSSTTLSLPNMEKLTMGLMHVVQQSHMHMMQAMMHGGHFQPQILQPQLVQPSLAALADRPFLRARSAAALPGFGPTVEDVGDESPVAGLPAAAPIGRASTAIAPTVANVGLTSPTQARTTSPEQVAPESPEAVVRVCGGDPCTNSDVLDLLDAMGERRAAAKVAKSKHATEDAPEGEPKPRSPQAKKATEAKGKTAKARKTAKAKAPKTKEPATAAAKLEVAAASAAVPGVAATLPMSKKPAIAVAKPEATPPAKTNEAAAPTGRPEAKAKPAAKPKAKGATKNAADTGAGAPPPPAQWTVARGGGQEVLVLIKGCSKCRWSQRGCGRCRFPQFTGLRWNTTVG